MHVIDNVHVKGSVLITRYSQPALVGRCARCVLFSRRNSATRDFDKQNLSRARGELPKLIILSVAFRRAVARIDSWTLKPISHPSNDPSLEILNSPFTEAPLRVTNINFHLLSTIDVSLETLPIIECWYYERCPIVYTERIANWETFLLLIL